MTRSFRPLLVVVVAIWSLTGRVQSQTGITTLPAALRTHLQAEQFQLVTAIRGFPLGVRDKLQELFGTGLDIANPGQPFQGTGQPVQSVPFRRLIVGGSTTDNHCLIYYERGGATITHRAILFQWSPDETRIEFGGVAPAGLVTIDDVKKALLSGAVKGSNPPVPW